MGKKWDEGIQGKKTQRPFILPLLLSHFSHIWLCVTPQTAAHQAPLSPGFSRQEHWSGLPFPSPSFILLQYKKMVMMEAWYRGNDRWMQGRWSLSWDVCEKKLLGRRTWCLIGHRAKQGWLARIPGYSSSRDEVKDDAIGWGRDSRTGIVAVRNVCETLRERRLAAMEHMAGAGQVVSVQRLWAKAGWMTWIMETVQKGGNMRPWGTSILMHDGEKATSEQHRDRKRRARRLLCPRVHTSERLPQGQWSALSNRAEQPWRSQRSQTAGGQGWQEVPEQRRGCLDGSWRWEWSWNDAGAGGASAMLQGPPGLVGHSASTQLCGLE